ncbi:sodium-dependent transporter, NSS family protein [Marinomonas sp. MED121]|uniref:sodium-dependent transporter n=1 Tax=Marinomonas sp. MED121 TaxID=314277 RepID=UPI0000690103|nr:sodium-dependent transporter [Marinomonas sp. MED121]EAQ65611.1 sodium-dependent transporter, NSS family protein [Marinomonas sp. MED121]
MPKNRCLQGIWASPWVFIFAAAGSAVGLGNLWKFPYMMGENGGGAFLFVYIICLLLVGLPVLIAEVALGRTVRSNPIDTVNDLSERRIIAKGWVGLPWLAGVVGFLVFSFYSVIAGWCVSYFRRAITGEFNDITLPKSQFIFDEMLAKPEEMAIWNSVFLVMVILAVGQSVTRGLAKLVKFLLPALIILLVTLSFYSLQVGDVAQTLEFLFGWKWSDITFDVVLAAVGHAFFSLSIGMGAMFAYGAYMSKHMSIARACSIVVGLDLLVALLAGLIIFPLVFAYDLDVASGPSLTFVSLPIVFGAIQGGQVLGGLFFTLMIIAALTSAISMLELFIAWLHERFSMNRFKAAILSVNAAWFIGLAVILSFNDWSNYVVMGLTFFELLDSLTSLVLLPISAIVLTVLVAWFIPQTMWEKELITRNPKHFSWWYVTLKYISLPAMLLIAVTGWLGA